MFNSSRRVEKDLFFPWLRSILPTKLQELVNELVEKQKATLQYSDEIRSVLSNKEFLSKVDSEKVLKLVSNLSDIAISSQLIQVK